jgi:1-phosphofructokinase family hexose kinase
MILIITLNPLLERRFIYPQIKLGEVNRNPVSSIAATGKGINVSRQLEKIGIKSFNFIFSGGNDGKLLRESLKEENLDFTSIITKSGTRNGTIVFSEKDNIVTSFFSNNPIITKSEADEFKLKLDKMIQNCEVVVFSGSSPCGETDSIIPYGIELANKYDKISICDTYGNSLKSCVEAIPTMIHNNYSEIENGYDIKLKNEESIVSFLNLLYKKNIKRAFLTNGSNNFYASNFDYIYKIKPLKIDVADPTGSGDSFVAGIIKGWINAEVFEDSLKFSTALASLNAATFDVSSVELNEAELFKNNVEIYPVGKKTKTIDDSPHEI